MDIVFSYSSTWLLLIFLLAALISYWFYRKDKAFGEQSIWIPRLLGLFRFISLSLIAFFLLEPLIRTETTEIQKPIIAIAVDNSESILNGSDSTYYKNDFINSVNALATELGESFEVDLLSFDESVKQGLDLNYDGKVSDLSNLLSELETRYYNRNLGAVIVASDGNYNKGINPSYAPIALSAPFYTVLLGDTGKVNDLAIDEIVSNSISFLGDDFPIEINVNAEGMNNSDYSLEIYHNGRRVFEFKGMVDSENWFKSISTVLPAEKTGIQKYTVRLKSTVDERIKQNNEAVFYINVLDERLKVAILTSSPHPDVAVWRNALKTNKNYEVEVHDVDEFNSNINDYSLFILYQLPANSNHIDLLNKIKGAKIPYLVQIGLTSKLDLLDQVFSENYSIDGNSSTEENIKIKINDAFSLFAIDKRIVNDQATFPPLRAPLVDVKGNEVYQHLMTKQLGKLDTGIPVWLLSESADTKNGIIIGEGIWRWSMTSFSLYGSHDPFNEFLQQTTKYLVRKGRNKRFDINIDKEYFEGNRIKLNARLLDPSMEAAIGGDISFNLKNSNNEVFEYALGESGMKYSLDLGALEAGDYTYDAKAILASETFRLKGSFTVKKMMLEQKDSHANASLMYQWANKTGGSLYYPDQLNKIKDKISQSNLSSISYKTESFSDMIRLNWLFFIIALFLSVEWFLRRFYGSY